MLLRIPKDAMTKNEIDITYLLAGDPDVQLFLQERINT
jgi:hypothetical protein